MATTIQVNLGNRGYDILVGADLLPRAGSLLAPRLPGRTALVVADATVGPLHGPRVRQSLEEAGFAVIEATIPAGEASKNLGQASRLYDQLAAMHADRQTLVLALGGGVVGDLAGFVAATYNRGLPFVQLPTTLLAMVDAAVGGKVAVDHPRGKNLIGAFHQPRLVLGDLGTLATLPLAELISGLAEVVKYGVILDADFFSWLERHADLVVQREPSALEYLVAHSCRIKARVVEQDEDERTGQRAILNFGHTFAHAFETAAGYTLLRHGEAVAIGMVGAAQLAKKLGRTDQATVDRITAICQRLGLPTRIPGPLRGADLLEIMRRDKKSQAGAMRFVLPCRIGRVEVVSGIPDNLVREVLEEHHAS